MTTSDNLKSYIVNRLYDSRFGKNLNPADISSLHAIRNDDKYYFNDSNSIPLKEVELRNVYLLEIFHINDFRKVRKGIIKLAKKGYAESGHFGEIDLKELESDLGSISTAFDQARFRKLIRLDFFKNKHHKSKPFSSATLQYWKTTESVIVLMIKLSLTQKAVDEFQNICGQRDESYNTPNFYSWKEILSRGRFIKSHSLQLSKKTEKLNRAINEICRPFEVYLKSELSGFFNDNSKCLPRILDIKTTNIKELNKDKTLSSWLNIEDYKNTFSNKNKYVTYKYGNFTGDIENQFVAVIDAGSLQKSSVEHAMIIEPVSFLWSLESYFSLKRDLTKNLKREVYDFANGFKIRKFDIYKYINTFNYRMLKYKISSDQIIYSIFENEFESHEDFLHYVVDIKKYRFHKHTSSKKEEINSLNYTKSQKILSQIDYNKGEIDQLNKRFKPIEELSIFNTNIALNLLIVVVTILVAILFSDLIAEVIKFVYSGFLFVLRNL